MELQIIVSKPGCFGATDFTEHESLLNENSLLAGGSYLHGDLESYMRYDIFAIVNGQDFMDLFKDKDYAENVPCKVHGYPHPCLGFFWSSGHRGLVVSSLDRTSIDFAKAKLKDRPEWL